MKPFVYVVLGSSESGKRTVLADLLQHALTVVPSATIYIPVDEAPCAPLEALQLQHPQIQFASWSIQDECLLAPQPHAGVSCSFFIFPGKRSPVEGLEPLRDWLLEQELSLARVISVLNVSKTSKDNNLKEWYDVCLHFTDVVVFTHEDKGLGAWSEAYKAAFRKAHYPCLFLHAPHGLVDNPSLALDHTVRRISQAFDEEIIMDDDEETEPETPYIDPYFERLSTGEYARPLKHLE